MRQSISQKCQLCSSNFSRPITQKFCSQKCAKISRRRGVMVNCCVCSLSVLKSVSDIKENKTKHFFCSKSCQSNPPSSFRTTISKSRISYLKNNPDKHPWKRKDKFISIPCQKLKELLVRNNIQFIEEFAPSQERSYSIDIAFPDRKIGIEVNGAQHYNRDGTLKPYYQARHVHIENLGWKLYQIYYSLCFDEPKILETINTILGSGGKYDFNYDNYLKQKLEISYQKEQERKRIKKSPRPPPPRQQLEKLLETLNQKEVAKFFNVTEQIVMRWRHKYNLKLNSTHSFSIPTSTICNCGNPKYKKAIKCYECDHISKRKVKRPTKEELYNLVWNYSTSEIARNFGLSDNAIGAWCKRYGIKKPERGYWIKVKFGHIIDYQI